MRYCLLNWKNFPFEQKFSHYIKSQKLFLFLLFFIVVSSLQAQKSVSGTVTAGDSILSGATVQVLGGSQSTLTDASGRYRIDVPPNSTLVFSYVGHTPQEIKVDNRPVINVQLISTTSELGDVVVIGYGTQRRKDLTGSVATVSGKNMETRPVSTFEDALAGLAPGIDVPPRSARPGNLSSISIRGIGSITGGYDPLYVVDGFPTDAASANAISPQDIQSIEILKDASSTAIYGSRGANGVIIITTKSGSAGRAQVTITLNGGFATAPKYEYYKSLNGAEYVEWYKEKAMNDGTPIPSWVTNWDGTSTNWQDLIYRTAPFQNYALSVSGGTEKANYLFSGNYIDQQDILLNAGYKKYTARAKVDFKPTKRISLGLNLAPSYTIQKLSAPDNDEGALTGAAIFLPPIIPARNADGTPSDPNSYGIISGVTLANPLDIAQKYKSTNNNFYLLSDAYVQVEILNGLTAKSTIGANIINARNKTFQPGMTGLGFSPVTTLSLSSASTVNWVNENTINYKRLLNNSHLVDFLVGYSAQKVTSDILSANANTFSNNLGQTIGFGTNKNAASDEVGNTLISYYSRLNYAFEDKYLFTATIRRDGSSRFGAKNRWGVFPSVAVGWNLSNENFIKDNLSFIDNAKIRGSYGVTGNNQIGDFTSRASLSTIQQSFNGLPVLGYINDAPGNPYLSWEKSLKTDVGLDLGLFKRFSLTFDYFNNVTKDMLLEVNVPTSTGYSTNLSNVGRMRNWGYEAAVNASMIKNASFSWDLGFNVTHLDQKVLDLGPNTGEIFQFFGALVTRVGGQLEQARGNQQIGILTEKDIANGVAIKPGDKPGDIKFLDVNNDGSISAYNGPDGVILGSNIPHWLYGINSNLRYKNWQLTALFQGQAGAQVFDFVYQLYSLHIFNWNIDHFLYDGRYISASEPGNGKTPRAGFNDVGAVSSWEMQSTDFFRIRNVNLSYSFPKTLTDKLYVQGLRAYVSVENLYTFTKFRGGNPEATRYNIGGVGGVVRLTGDSRTLSLNSTPTPPIPRVFTFGLNFTF